MPFAPLDDSHSPPSQELRHFTNRVSELEAFGRALAIPAGQDLPAIMFYGVGGTGKSWVLKRLRQSLDGSLPCAYLDLDPSNPGGAACHTDWSRALAEIRRQLGAAVFCPRFDLAYAFIRYKEGAGDEPLFRGAGILGHVWEFLVEVGDAGLNSVPGGNLITWAINKITAPVAKKLKTSPLGNWLETQLGEEDFRKLKPLLADEIYPQLHRRLLTDLRENLPASDHACRAVVFLDTLEALRAPRDSAEELARVQEWVRELYHPSSGVLLVMAGRDRLAWERIEPAFADPQYLDQHLVGGLSQADALRFLRSCGVAEPALQQAVLRVARDVETQTVPKASAADGDTTTEEPTASYHPFSLGLAVDTIAAAQRSGQHIDAASFDMPPGDIRRLAARFLRSLGTDGSYSVWLHRLALTPRFDEAAARAAFSSHAGSEQDAAWNALREYSFFQPAGVQNDGWWSLHGRMREALAESQDDAVEAAGHRWWGAHWLGRCEHDLDTYAALAWYHFWCLTPEEAIRVWTDLSQRERRALRMDNHYRLLSWWDPCRMAQRCSAIEVLESDAVALFSIGYAYTESTIGQHTANLNQALACAHAALRAFKKPSSEVRWAAAQNLLGTIYADLPTKDLDANLRKAITCYEAALTVYSERESPQRWAETMCNVGLAYANLPTDNRDKNVERAISYLEAALRVFQKDTYPTEWARTQRLLATTFLCFRHGNHSTHTQKASQHLEAAMSVFTESADPMSWALTQDALGTIHAELPDGDRDQNLQAAAACFLALLDTWREETFPENWARTQSNLGNVYREMNTGNRDDNLRKALAYYEAALRIYTEADFPIEWARNQYWIGRTHETLAKGSLPATIQYAIECYQAALRVYTESGFPVEWAGTQCALASAYRAAQGENRAQSLQRAIDCCEAAIRVFTEADHPRDWAIVQSAMGGMYLELKSRNGADTIKLAIDHFQAALRVFTEQHFPHDWAKVQRNLGGAYQKLQSDDQDTTLQEAIAHYQAALRVRTEAACPYEWAQTHLDLGHAYLWLTNDDRAANREEALVHADAALRVFTSEKFPGDWAKATRLKAVAYLGLIHYGRPEWHANVLSVEACWQLAQDCLHEAAQQFRELGDLENYQDTMQMLALLNEETPSAK